MAPPRPRGPAAAHADFLVDQAEQRRHRQPRDQQDPDHRIDDEDDVPGVPAIIERLEQANAVSGGVVEQQMTERRQHGAEIEIAPAHRQRRRRTG